MDLVEDYWRWVQRKMLKDTPCEPTAEGVEASEPISVLEHHASTTIIEKLYNVLGKRS